VELARRLTGWSQRAIGERYGGITSQAVSMIARKVREEAEGSTMAGASLRREMERLAELLGKLQTEYL